MRAGVTAAGRDIGRTGAELLAREGARVIAAAINADALATLQGYVTERLDLLDGDAIVTSAQTVGDVDILFNCAGFVHAGTILATDDRDHDCSIDLNVKSACRMVRAILPGLIAQGDGSIVNMSSVAGSVIGVADLSSMPPPERRSSA